MACVRLWQQRVWKTVLPGLRSWKGVFSLFAFLVVASGCASYGSEARVVGSSVALRFHCRSLYPVSSNHSTAGAMWLWQRCPSPGVWLSPFKSSSRFPSSFLPYHSVTALCYRFSFNPFTEWVTFNLVNNYLFTDFLHSIIGSFHLLTKS